MPITVAQRWNGASVTLGPQRSVVSEYVVAGAADEFAAHEALTAAAPLWVGGLVRQTVSIAERLAEDAWHGEVQWGSQEPPEPGQSEFFFDTGGGTQHVTQSLATVARYAPPGETAPDFQGAIGVTASGVEGCDLVFPAYAFGETHRLAAAAVTPAYKAALFTLTGRVNAGTFRGFAAGEVLFLGASGAQRDPDLWEVTFRFSASPNASGLAVGPITGINKQGWEYLWVRYHEATDDAAHAVVQRPAAVYVERVYPLGDFAGLGIGG